MKPKAYLEDTPVSQLRDIGLIEDALSRQLARLRAKRDNILRQKAKAGDIQLTDHAIVRYLERVEGLDLAAVSERIRAYVAECQPSSVKGITIHPSGLQVVRNRIGTVVTILPQDYAAVDFEEKETKK